MNTVHEYLLSYIQKFVNFSAKHGFSLFFLVEVSFGIHTTIFIIKNGFVFYWMLMLLSHLAWWIASKPFIKPSAINPRRYDLLLFLLGTFGLFTGIIFLLLR